MPAEPRHAADTSPSQTQFAPVPANTQDVADADDRDDDDDEDDDADSIDLMLLEISCR